MSREDEGHVDSTIQILEEKFDFPPVIFIRIFDMGSEEGSDRLDVVTSPSTEEE